MNIQRRRLLLTAIVSVSLFGVIWTYRSVESEESEVFERKKSSANNSEKPVYHSDSRVTSESERAIAHSGARREFPQKIAGLVSKSANTKPPSWRKVFSDLDEQIIDKALSNSIEPKQEYVYGSDQENWLELSMVENFTDSFEAKRKCRHLLEKPGQCSWKTKVVLQQDDPSSRGSQLAAVSAEITSPGSPECEHYVSCYLENRWSSKGEFPALKQGVQAIEFVNTKFVSEENPSGRGLVTEDRLESQKQALAQCEIKLKQFEVIKENDPNGEGGSLDKLEHAIRSTRQRSRISRDLVSFLTTALEHTQAEN